MYFISIRFLFGITHQVISVGKFRKFGRLFICGRIVWIRDIFCLLCQQIHTVCLAQRKFSDYRSWFFLLRMCRTMWMWFCVCAVAEFYQINKLKVKKNRALVIIVIAQFIYGSFFGIIQTVFLEFRCVQMYTVWSTELDIYLVEGGFFHIRQRLLHFRACF